MLTKPDEPESYNFTLMLLSYQKEQQIVTAKKQQQQKLGRLSSDKALLLRKAAHF